MVHVKGPTDNAAGCDGCGTVLMEAKCIEVYGVTSLVMSPQYLCLPCARVLSLGLIAVLGASSVSSPPAASPAR